MALLTFEDIWPEVWTHQYPRVTNAKGTPTRRVPRAAALEYPYIEPNITGILVSQIVIDRDLPDADRIAEHKGLLEPSSVSINAHTTTGHIRYGLKDPVPLTDAARRPPVNYLARIEHGLVTVLGGDPGYTGGLTKNPFHLQHPTLWGSLEALYGLRELAANLDGLGALPSPRNPRRNVFRSGVGRNVALFDDTRAWAYRAVRQFWGAPATEWQRAVYAHAWELNETRIANDFTAGGLTATEVGHLATSVAGWVWKRFTPQRFSERQAALGRKGGLKGAAVANAKREANRMQRAALIEVI